MQDQYTAPELTFAGQADEVVLGIPGLGGDFLGNFMVGGDEFLED